MLENPLPLFNAHPNRFLPTNGKHPRSHKGFWIALFRLNVFLIYITIEVTEAAFFFAYFSDFSPKPACCETARRNVYFWHWKTLTGFSSVVVIL